VAAHAAAARFTGAMVLPGGTSDAVPLSIAPTDLRQLADHDAAHRRFAGGAGPLVALDTGPADGGTVLLVAGFTGTKEDFAPLLRPLCTAGYRAVALDQRGQYESPGPDDPDAYTVAELAADVIAVGRVLRAENPGPLHLLGHSFGGLVARAAVLAEPALFSSLTLLGSGPARLVGPRVVLLEHLGPLLEAGGVPAVHEAMEQFPRPPGRSSPGGSSPTARRGCAAWPTR
jgi:pimeloyl-ACP methyl ester carboxylesterase